MYARKGRLFCINAKKKRPHAQTIKQKLMNDFMESFKRPQYRNSFISPNVGKALTKTRDPGGDFKIERLKYSICSLKKIFA